MDFGEGSLDLGGRRLLVLIVAYNAEKTIRPVLNRIPACLRQPSVEVLVIDDSSRDETFAVGRKTEVAGLKVTVLRNPVNQGYGGNQKLGYHYAIEKGFDIVALVHGDGQYAPEKLPELLLPILGGRADAVFGSRMMVPGAALRGGMPFYKYAGNRVISAVQNRLLRTSLSEFHSGYRLYTTDSLRQIPFDRNTGDFHFDTEIIVQLLLRKLRIVEVPIPTFYGEEICHVNGLRYGWDVIRTCARARLHQVHLLHDRKFEIGEEESQPLKLGYASSHADALAAVRPGGKILDLGCGDGRWSKEAARIGAEVTGIDRLAPAASRGRARFLQADLDAGELPVSLGDFDQIFLLDSLASLKNPEAFMESLRVATGRRRPEILITAANIGFFVTRFMLLFGEFNHGRRGILDRAHARLFTFRTLRQLLENAGFVVSEMHGIPAPVPLALGKTRLARLILGINLGLIRVSRGLFAYQIFVRATATPTLQHLLDETVTASEAAVRA